MSKDNAAEGPITTQDAIVIAGEFFATKNTEVLDFGLTSFSKDSLGFLASHKLLTVEAQEKNSPESRRTLKFFVKLSKKADAEFIMNAFRNEAKFFSDVAPKLMENFTSDPWSAKCFLARADVIVLEDLRLAGFRSVNKLLNAKQMKSAISMLARFHACSMLLESTSKSPLSEIFPEFMSKNILTFEDGHGLKWLQTGCEVVEAVAINLNLNYKFIWPAYQIYMENYKMKKSQKIILGHNDLWFNNLMFSDDEKTECRLLDFQFAGPTFYMIDLVQLIYLNNTKESRLKMEKEFIEVYHEELVKCLKMHGHEEVISLDQMFSDYEEKKVFGLVFAVQHLPITLLNKKATEKYVQNMEKYLYVSRKDFVLDVFKEDAYYRCRIKENVEELIQVMASDFYKNK